MGGTFTNFSLEGMGKTGLINETKEMENKVHEMAENMKYATFERSVYLSKVKDIEKKHLEKEIRVECEKYSGM